MKKALLIVGGALAALIGLGILAGGVALLVLFGTDGEIESGSHPVAATGRALVSESTTIVDSAPLDAGGGIRLRVSVEPTNGKEVFVGIGPADDVDTFLSGVAVDEIADFELRPYKLETTPIPGEAVPGDPNDESFWHAAASGTEGAAIDWKVESGAFRLVIMNVDTSAGVEGDGKLGVKVPFTVPAGITAIVLGVILAGVGVLLLVLGLRTPSGGSRQTASGLPQGAPLPPPPPQPG